MPALFDFAAGYAVRLHRLPTARIANRVDANFLKATYALTGRQTDLRDAYRHLSLTSSPGKLGH